MDPTIIVAVISGISSIAVALISKPKSSPINSKSKSAILQDTHNDLSENIYLQEKNKDNFNRYKWLISGILGVAALGGITNYLINEHQRSSQVNAFYRYIEKCGLQDQNSPEFGRLMDLHTDAWNKTGKSPSRCE